MDQFEIVDKLKVKAGISYEEAETALKNSNWDILDAMLYLENHGKVKKPSVSVFYTNENEKYESLEQEAIYPVEVKKERTRRNNSFEGIFEAICKIIDKGNNIFLEVSRKGRNILRIPLTVLILLFIFTFWILIPLIIVGLFFDMEFSVSAKSMNTDKINKVLAGVVRWVWKVKNKIKGSVNK